MTTNAAPAPESAEVEAQEVETTETEETPKPKAEPKAEPKKDSGKKAAPKKGPSPWEAELDQRGITDPQVREYLAEKQGYITQTEQKAAQFAELFDAGDGSDPLETANIAANVMRGLSTDPVNTIAQIVGVLGEAGITPEEVAAAVLGADPEDLEFDLDDPTDAYDEDSDTELDPRQQWIEQKMAEEQQRQADEAYEHVCNQIAETHPGFNQQVFDRYVLAEEGDIEAAYNAYRQDFPPQPKQAAPPVAGSGGPPPAPAPNYSGPDGLDNAIGDFLAELNAGR